MVSDHRDEIRCFITVVLDDLQEKCHSATLHDNMNTYRIMVQAQYVEEARDKRKSRDAKKESYFHGGSSKNKL